MGACARLRTDEALTAAMNTAGHNATSLAAQVRAYGYPVTRQMITKLMHPRKRYGSRTCKPALAIYIAQGVRMPVEFIFDMPQPQKMSDPRRSMPSRRKIVASSTQDGKSQP